MYVCLFICSEPNEAIRALDLQQLIAVEKREKGYLRFLKSLIPSSSVMYWNPCSMRSVASSMVDAVLQVYSSFSVNVISCV